MAFLAFVCMFTQLQSVYIVIQVISLKKDVRRSSDRHVISVEITLVFSSSYKLLVQVS